MQRTEQIGVSVGLESVHRIASESSPVARVRTGALRLAAEIAGGAAIIDDLAPGRASCCFLRLTAAGLCSLAFARSGTPALRPTRAGGWLLGGAGERSVAYWLPSAPALRRVDAHGRILAERPIGFRSIALDRSQAAVEFEVEPGWVLDLVVWRLADPAVAAELDDVARIEHQPIFLWGSHSAYAEPADVYRHLVHGAVYESGFAWPHQRRICSENDAHALYVTLGGLERATGKVLYALLKRQVLLSVLARQRPDGGFRHGEWTDRMETHFQFVSSAVHLFTDALAEQDDPAVREALVRAVAYLSRHHDTLDAGAWFLHDDLELGEPAMNDGPFEWLKTRALGKSETNMLVLPTHLEATIALDRFAEATGDPRYSSLVASARSATRAVLALRPAEWLYRLLFRAIGLTLLPSGRAAALPLPLRAVKRAAWQFLIPRLHRVRTRFPRLVMPGGYIDRAIPLAGFAYHYLTININDLVRYRRRFPEPALDSVIDSAVRMTRTSGVLERWAELKYERYAIGFWAEALYQLCIDSPDPACRGWLADAVLALVDLEMGLPPSLLGSNAEAVPVTQQRPCPSPADARLRVANLSCARGAEFLVVNTAREPVAADLEGSGAALALGWRDAAGRPLQGAIPGRSWALATA